MKFVRIILKPYKHHTISTWKKKEQKAFIVLLKAVREDETATIESAYSQWEKVHHKHPNLDAQVTEQPAEIYVPIKL